VLLLLLLEDFSETELPLGEFSLDAEFEEACSCVTTTGAGATTTGAGTMTTAGADAGAAAVTVSLRWLSEELSMLSALALPITTLPRSAATPKDNAAVFSFLFIMIKLLERFGLAEQCVLSGRT
jgi:hypothetical protein